MSEPPTVQHRLRPPTHGGPQRSNSGSNPSRRSKSGLTAQAPTPQGGGLSSPSTSTIKSSEDWLPFGDDDDVDDTNVRHGSSPPHHHQQQQQQQQQEAPRPRPRPQRTLSERRSVGGAFDRRAAMTRHSSTIVSKRGSFGASSGLDSRSDHPRGSTTTATSSGTGSGGANTGALGRQSSSTHRSSSEHEKKRESMKAIYRTGPDDHKIRATHSTGNHNSHESAAAVAAATPSSGGGETTATHSNPVPMRRHRPRTMSGLEAGPLLALAATTPNRHRSHDSIPLTGSGSGSIALGSSHRSSYSDASYELDDEEGDDDDVASATNDHHPSPTAATSTATPDAKWLERRATKMEEIMALAHTVKERFEEEREAKEMAPNHLVATDSNYSTTKNNDGEEDDEDQPMAFRAKKTMLQQLAKGVQKTGKGARSLGKGTVNAIHDPKLAAKRLGHLSKDVGMATVKTAMDPKKMAIGAAMGAKKVTVGSAMIGAGLTKGVAKTTFDASKAVVKGGVKATTTSAKLTMKGTKKVVKGTVRAVTGKEKVKIVKEQEYDSRHIADRNQSNLYDRISSMVGSGHNTASSDDGSDDRELLEDAILAGIAAKKGDTATGEGVGNRGGDYGGSSNKRAFHRPSSVLMPTNLLGASVEGASWDV